MSLSRFETYLAGDEQDKLDLLEESIKVSFSQNGCGCVKDLPGDGYTCTHCQFLYQVAVS